MGFVGRESSTLLVYSGSAGHNDNSTNRLFPEDSVPGCATYLLCIDCSHNSLRLVPLSPQVYNDELELREVERLTPTHAASDGVVI